MAPWCQGSEGLLTLPQQEGRTEEAHSGVQEDGEGGQRPRQGAVSLCGHRKHEALLPPLFFSFLFPPALPTLEV